MARKSLRIAKRGVAVRPSDVWWRRRASWRQRLATGPPERLTRGVEGGGGRREAVPSGAEGRGEEGTAGAVRHIQMNPASACTH